MIRNKAQITAFYFPTITNIVAKHIELSAVSLLLLTGISLYYAFYMCVLFNSKISFYVYIRVEENVTEIESLI